MYKFSLFLLFFPLAASAQHKFAQLDSELPTPNEFRTAAGAPGNHYYQQKADYKISLSLDDEKQMIKGEEIITYTNNSPDKLEYLWLQLDQNIYKQDADNRFIQIEKMEDFKSIKDIERKMFAFDGGFNIENVSSTSGEKMKYAINKTMMRIDPKSPLGPGQSLSFKVKWWFNINDRMKVGGRSGFEYFEADKNYLYTIAQFFPRMCVYNDVEGWQNKQFLGSGEFTLPFGDYEVSITVPSDHIVSGTGELQNINVVLNAEQRSRFVKAKVSNTPVLIVTQKEAEENEKTKDTGTKTWIYKAKNVRDFAFASSRKFIWDAQNTSLNGKNVLCMSFYPKEGNPLWERYSTKLVAHTIQTYSKFTVDYPYPVAISVHSDRIGMEYPMICFNGGRPKPDGTYSEETKYGMWGVIIHEVGHNFFPMIINSDERQWSWMDEGLNTFVQYLTEQEWERNYPSTRGPAANICNYMRGDKKYISPIMTNSESIYQFGNNAYGKPATALNILRETVMGRELFDYSFKIYCERWKFKHPTPADFFRTMEDASAVDLDWFWRGWFFGTDFVDLKLDYAKHFQLNSFNLEMDFAAQRSIDQKPIGISEIRNKESIKQTVNERDVAIDDFYATYDKYAVDQQDLKEYQEELEKLSADQKKLLESNKHFYELSISNVGGLVTPIILEATFTDGTKELIRIPAEIWRKDEVSITKVFWFNKEVIQWVMDPYFETADCNVVDNSFPPKSQANRFELFQQKLDTENPMQRAKRLKEEK
jgi:hypothetical protein